jgi:hypothetical protein
MDLSPMVRTSLYTARYYFKAERSNNPNEMEIEQPTEKPYLIVRSLKNRENEQKGYPLGTK